MTHQRTSWQMGESPEHGWRSSHWQQGEWSTGASSSHEMSSGIPWWHATEEDDANTIRSQGRMRPPKRVREYQQEQARRMVARAIEERTLSISRPPPPPVPPTAAEVNMQRPKEPTTPRSKGPGVHQVKSPVKAKSPPSQGIPKAALHTSVAIADTVTSKSGGPKKRPAPNPVVATADERVNLANIMNSVMKEARQVKDEIDGGLMLARSRPEVAKKLSSWRYACQKMNSAHQEALTTCDALEYFLRAGNREDEEPTPEIERLIIADEIKDMGLNDFDAASPILTSPVLRDGKMDYF